MLLARLTHTSEDCTKVANEYNVCWSKQENNLRYLNKTRLNETFSSLSSAQPTAMSFTVNTNDLYLLTSTYPSTASTSPTASTSTNPNSSNGSGLSGSAIGGIVGGVVGGVALLGALAFFLWRRRYNANKNVNPHTSPVDPYQKYGYQPGFQPPMVETHEAPPYSAQQGVPVTVGSADKYAHVGQPPVAEVPGYQNPVEMDGGYQDQAHQANQVK
jgi:MYXO-CTERM domain-containing protein